MNFLDMKTVIFSHIMTDVVCAVVMAFLWYRDRDRFAGLSFWLASYVLQVVAVFLILMRGSIPDIMSVAISNTLVMAGALAMYMGLERFVGKTGSQTHNYTLLAVLALVHTYFTLIQPNLTARTVNISMGILIFTVQCMWLLVRRADASLRPMTRGLGMVFGCLSLVSVIRVIVILARLRLENDFFRVGPLETLFVLTYQVLLIIQAYSLTLLVNRRLLGDVLIQEEKFSKAFRSSPYAITLTRVPDGRILEANDGFMNMTGFQYPEVIGKTTLDLDLWAKEEDRAVALDELSKSNKIHGEEFQFRKKSGELMTGLFSAEVIMLNNQKCALSSINDITKRKLAEEERVRLIRELQESLAKVRTLSGMLPICSSCKKIRDDKGYWTQIEAYIRDHSEAEFSHGICPDCMKKLYGDVLSKRDLGKEDGA